MSSTSSEVQEPTSPMVPPQPDEGILLKKAFKINFVRSHPKQLKFLRIDPDGVNYNVAEAVADDFIIAKDQTKMSEIISSVGELNAKWQYLEGQVMALSNNSMEEMQDVRKSIQQVNTLVDVISTEYHPAALKQMVYEIRDIVSNLSERMNKIVADMTVVDDTLVHHGSQLFDYKVTLDSCNKEIVKLQEMMDQNLAEDAKKMEQISTLNEKVAMQETQIANLTNTFEGLTLAFSEHKEATEQRLAAAESKQGEIEESSHRMKELERRVDELTGRMAKMDEELKTLKISDQSMYQIIDEVKELADTNEAGLYRLEKDAHQMNNRIDELNKEITACENGLSDMKEEIEKILEKIKDSHEDTATVKTTMEEAVLPSIKGLAVDIKELKDTYHMDLIRVERDCTNRVDSVAADILHRVTEVQSDTLANTTEMNDVKVKMEDLSGDVREIKQLFQNDWAVLGYE